MEIIKCNVKNLIIEMEYKFIQKYSDNQLNTFFNYWNFFEEKEKKIQELGEISLDTILYSKYYWCTQCKNRYNKIYGRDVGIEQQQYKIIEEIEQKQSSVNWQLLQMIDEGNV